MLRIESYYLVKKFLFKLGIGNQVRSIIHWCEDLFDKNILLRNRVLKGVYRGKRCFIFGNGLSVNDIDMSLLTQEYSFGSNFLNYHRDFHKLNVNFYASVSQASVLRNIHLNANYSDSKIYSEEDLGIWLNEKIPVVTYSFDPAVFFPRIDSDLSNNTLLFLGADCRRYVEKNGIFKNKKVFYLKPYKSVLEASEQRIDLCGRISFYGSVAFFMLAVVLYMGFEEIYLVGWDYSFEPCQEFHFYDSLLFSKKMNAGLAVKLMDEVGEKRKINLHKIEEDDAFYRPVYVRYNTDKSAYVVVRDLAVKKKVKIFNIVPDGFGSPVFEKVSWDYVVKNVLPKTLS